MAKFLPPPIPKEIKENGPVEDNANTGDPMYLGKWVAEVVIAHPNGDLIRKYYQQQKRLEEVCMSYAGRWTWRRTVAVC